MMFSSPKSSIDSFHARPISRGFPGILNGSIFSDFPTLNTLISAGFGVCPSAPYWPGGSGMMSCRARGLFASSLRRFLAFFSSNSSKFSVA